MTNTYNLLEEPLLGVRLQSGATGKLSLPEVLERLGAGEIEAFTALRPHQSHALHAFLVQLAAMALDRQGQREPHQKATVWKDWLLALSSNLPSAWCLVEGDLEKPAFLQPPVPEGSLDGFGRVMATPDELDILVTAKNHDLKAARMRNSEAEHWIYALISLQTMQGFLGAGNYGIARMNGGFSSRPGVAFANGLSPSSRFSRDVAKLVNGRKKVLESLPFDESGHALLWLLPWDGTTSLPLEKCDPWFIEVCRRVRLRKKGERLVVLSCPTKKSRVEAKDACGVTGDPWTPVDVKEGKAITVGSEGFGYRLVQELLLGSRYALGCAGELGEDDAFFVASVLVRGQGKTEGWHERVIPVPPRARRLMLSADEKRRLGQRAQRWVQHAGTVENKVLKPGLLALLQAGEEDLNFKDDRPGPWLEAFDRSVDEIFFPELWASLDEKEDPEDVRWCRRLLELAEVQLRRAEQSVPLAEARRFRAIAVAERVFRTAAHKHLGPVLSTAADAGVQTA